MSLRSDYSTFHNSKTGLVTKNKSLKANNDRFVILFFVTNQMPESPNGLMDKALRNA